MEFSASPFPDPLPKEPIPNPPPSPIYTSSSFPAPEFPAWPAPTSPAQEKLAPASWSSAPAAERQDENKADSVQIEEFAEDNPRGFWKKIAGTLVMFFLVALGFWFIFAPEKESPPPTPAPTDAAYIQGKPKNPHLVFAETGGQIAYADGAALIIPARALAADTEIFIDKAAEGDATDLYEIKPHGLRFLKPALLEIPYKSIEPHKIVLEFWSAGNNPQREMLRFTVDWKNKKLRAYLFKL